MASVFFDTSALVKRYVNEAGSQRVRALITGRPRVTIYIARITCVEIHSAVAGRQRIGNLTGTQVSRIIRRFRRHIQGHYRILEVSIPVVEHAMMLATDRALRAYDAVQLAAALEIQRVNLQLNAGPITLISSDLALNAAATLEGLIVEDPTTLP